MEFASRKEAAAAFDLLKKANVKLNYANLSSDRPGVRAKVADIAFDSFRKTLTPAKENVSHLISKFEAVTVTSDSPPVVHLIPLPPSPPPLRKVPDEMDQSPSISGKTGISAEDANQMINHLVQVLESVDSVCKTCASGKEVKHLHYILQEQVLLDPVLDAPPAMQQLTCTLCRADSKLMKCTGCDHSSYCSRTCQVRDWPRHRRICNATQSPAPSVTASPAVSLNYSQMSPNGSLEQITAPLTNGSAKMMLSNGAGDRVKVRSEKVAVPDAALVPEPKSAPTPKVADVADGTTPVRQTAITRTRIEEPPSSGRSVSSRTDSGSPAKTRAGQMMREMLAQPLDGSSPVKRASPPVSEVQAVVLQKAEKPVRKLEVGVKQNGLIVWQDEADPDIFFLSGDENTIYNKINKFTLPAPDSVGFLPNVGAYVLARSTDDNEFYRAEVTGVRGDDVAVVFIDYGNKDNVKSAEVRAMPKEIDPATSAYPPQAVKITHQDKNTQKEIANCFNAAQELRFTPIEHKDDYYIITV